MQLKKQDVIQKIQIIDATYTLHQEITARKYDEMGHYAIARDIRRKFLKDREKFSVTQETSEDFNSYKSIALQCTLTDTLMKLYVLSLQTPLVHAAEGHV